jgi:uncharacterized lipoprotein YddW (UPF0748 family)
MDSPQPPVMIPGLVPMPSSPLHSVALALLGTCLLAAATVTAQTELRGVWVARDGLTSRTKIQLTLDQLQAANINLVCVNVWSRGYTLYPSAVLQATCGVTMDPDPAYVGRDPFAEFVFEAHRRGVVRVRLHVRLERLVCGGEWHRAGVEREPDLDRARQQWQHAGR